MAGNRSWCDNILAWLGVTIVGLTGIFPLALNTRLEGPLLNYALAFAVGALLFEVFLELFPKIYGNEEVTEDGEFKKSVYILLGLTTSVVLEIVLGFLKSDQKATTAYLNLIANAIDNFSHGICIGGAFSISRQSGIRATIAIIFHEVPHEFGDFAIIKNGGFTDFWAATYQMITAAFGVVGALSVLRYRQSSKETESSWIDPFIAGSLLHIVLVTILPSILRDDTTIDDIDHWARFWYVIIALGSTFLFYAINTILEEHEKTSVKDD
ncbi:zinc transporter ZIP13 homolog [Euwallacea fornicatus]|uniref:zinc transporter ZIP13 homolog n=1 Tax=Euwallacea fornicatus TaxID=995702 RepID=UPI00338F252D